MPAFVMHPYTTQSSSPVHYIQSVSSQIEEYKIHLLGISDHIQISFKTRFKPSSESVFQRDTGVQKTAAFSKHLSPHMTSLVQGSLKHMTLCTDLRSRTPSCTVSN